MRVLILVIFYTSSMIYGQDFVTNGDRASKLKLSDKYAERIGNFSMEVIYNTKWSHNDNENVLVSPMTIWTVLAAIFEGSQGDTQVEIGRPIRISSNKINQTRQGIQMFHNWLFTNSSNIEMYNVNAILVDKPVLLLRDFKDDVKTIYKVDVIPLDFSKEAQTANAFNEAISAITHERISKLVDNSDFKATPVFLASALDFKGQWISPFDSSRTRRMPFYDSIGRKIGEVNMMYNSFTYPYSNIKELQARVIELPYGTEGRLSMLIILPNRHVMLRNVMLNFKNVSIKAILGELRLFQEENENMDIHCFIPRFKIEYNIDMKSVLKRMGIVNIFNETEARLPHFARSPVHVSKVIHKTQIEVIEGDISPTAETAGSGTTFNSEITVLANKPFLYLIIEKVTNTIVLGGFYEYPTLY